MGDTFAGRPCRLASMLSALALITLGACDANWAIDFVSYEQYSTSEATVAVLYKPMPVVVLGNPTVVSDDALAMAVAEGLQGSHIVHDTVFKPSAPGEIQPYRTVIAFGAIGQADICSTMPASVPAGPAQMMNAAFCRGSEPLSYLQSRIGKADDPMASPFQKHVQAVGLQLFPRENPNVDR
jgi:hypothetical protein